MLLTIIISRFPFLKENNSLIIWGILCSISLFPEVSLSFLIMNIYLMSFFTFYAPL